MRHNLLFLTFLLVGIQASFGFTYYVSTNGSDSKNTGSKKSPLHTIQKAVSSAVAGDSIFVTAGTYSEKITFGRSGTSKNPIVLMGIGTVIVNGNGVQEWEGIINIVKRSYITISNLQLLNSYWFGFYVNLGSSHITITNCSTYSTGASGIYVACSNNILADNNTIRKACYQNIPDVHSQECISFKSDTNFKITNNEVYESGGSLNGGEGIDSKQACRSGVIANNVVHDLDKLGIYVDAYASVCYDIQVLNNKVYNCQNGIALSSEQGGTALYIRIYNNLVYKNSVNGIIVSAWDVNGPRRNIQILNNTCYKNGSAGWGGGIIVEQAANVDSLIIYNNICSNNVLWGISTPTKMVNNVQNNLVYPYLNKFWAYEVLGSKYIVKDPKFVDTATGDFSLQQTSSAIGKGTSSFAPAWDMRGVNRYACCIDLGSLQTFEGQFKEDLVNDVEEEGMGESASLNIYLNQDANLIMINNPNASGSIDLKVLNIQGVVFLTNTVSGSSSVSIDNLPAGCYVVEANSGNQKVSKKIIKN